MITQSYADITSNWRLSSDESCSWHARQMLDVTVNGKKSPMNHNSRNHGRQRTTETARFGQRTAPNRSKFISTTERGREDVCQRRAFIQCLPPQKPFSATQRAVGGTGPLDICALAQELATQVGSVHNGDLSRCEQMLFAQVHTLDAIFANLASRASSQDRLLLPHGRRCIS